MLVPRIVGRFKMNSAKSINDLRGTPGGKVWQRNYYEHVIRDEASLDGAREYILTNPQRWGEDPDEVGLPWVTHGRRTSSDKLVEGPT